MAGQAFAIADSVVTAINAKGDYTGYTFTAQRKILANAKIDRESTTELSVFVIPGNLTATAQTQNQFSDDYTVRVFVIDEVDKGDNSNNYSETQVSNLLRLVEEIQSQVVTYADANPGSLSLFTTFENNPLIDDEFMERGVFLSVTTFTFRHYRSV